MAWIGRAHDVKDYRSRDVIGDISHDDVRPVCQCGNVCLKNIAFDDCDARIGRVSRAKLLAQRAIDLNCDERVFPRRENIRPSAAAGTDLDYSLVGKRSNSICDSLKHAVVIEKMLTESLEHRRMTAPGCHAQLLRIRSVRSSGLGTSPL